MEITPIFGRRLPSAISWANKTWLAEFVTMSRDEKMDALCDAGNGNLCNPLRVVRSRQFKVEGCKSETFFALMSDRLNDESYTNVDALFFVAGDSESVVVRGMIGLLAAWHENNPISEGQDVLQYLQHSGINEVLSPQRLAVLFALADSLQRARSLKYLTIAGLSPESAEAGKI